jgi:UTP--glucose-1-phosphate uridylyltransferase
MLDAVRIRKAVIPAAGLGTRFLPATKAIPKEMIPLVDKPGIQYVIEEAVGAGITDILIVTGRSKKAIEDHFDRSFELEASLAASGKDEMVERMRALAGLADIHYIRQEEPRGLGHAVVVAIEGDVGADDVVRIITTVEKPARGTEPSDLAIIGRYVLTPDVFDRIARLKPGAIGEIQLTDALCTMAEDGPFYGLVIDGGRYDIGNKLDWLRATIEVALHHPEVGPGFRTMLHELLTREGAARS